MFLLITRITWHLKSFIFIHDNYNSLKFSFFIVSKFHFVFLIIVSTNVLIKTRIPHHDCKLFFKISGNQIFVSTIQSTLLGNKIIKWELLRIIIFVFRRISNILFQPRFFRWQQSVITFRTFPAFHFISFNKPKFSISFYSFSIILSVGSFITLMQCWSTFYE